MRRYPIDHSDLIHRIRLDKPNWLERARSRLRAFFRQDGYFETDAAKPFWGELKPLYLQLQSAKCVYCDRTLDDIEYGALEMDMEHYRPKRNVVGWPSTYLRHQHAHLGHYTSVRGASLPGGYWRLSYHPLNLAVSCIRCNRRVKLGYFPVAGNRSTIQGGGISPRCNEAEDPDLFYPIGHIDPDSPEDCITFHGPFARPALDVTLRQRERAKVTIDLLHLNERPELIRGRSRVMCSVYAAHLLSRSQIAENRRVGLQELDRLRLVSEPHSKCAACFLLLCIAEPVTAEQLYEEAFDRLHYL